MKDPLAHNFDLRIEGGTKSLILDMIRSIRSVIPVVDETGFEDMDCTIQEEKLNGYVSEVIRMSDEHPEILTGIFDLNELKAYLKYSQDYQEISNQLQDLLSTIKQHHERSKILTMRLAACLREHLDMVAPDLQEQSFHHMMSVIHKNESGKVSPGTNDLKVVS